MPQQDRIGVGLYGDNGHQIASHLVDHPQARLVATAEMPESKAASLREDSQVVPYDTLDQLLADERVDLVSLCSPRRTDQAEHAIRCLEAGRHVYAEKPAAMNEADLDAIVATAERTGGHFREMAGTAFAQPYRRMRTLVAEGWIGPVVQVLAQKSYPMRESRPRDEAVDGGLTLQAGAHAARMIEHIARVRIDEVTALETQLGVPGDVGALRMACTMQMRLEGGGLAAAICNYLNPPPFPRWGNEMVRIFGTAGYLESIDGGQHTRLVTHERDQGAIRIREPDWHYHDLLFAAIRGQGQMPLSLEEELHPTRIVIRARESARKKTGG